MQVILLERVENLGQMGDTVTVKTGFARNFLLPQNKALRANKDNLAFFETQKSQLEASNLKKKQEAEKVATKLDGVEVIMIRQASDKGQLYGSVRSYDIREALEKQKIEVEKNQIVLQAPIKEIGVYDIRVKLHPEVDAMIKVNIAKSDDEAETQRDIDASVLGDVESVEDQLAADKAAHDAEVAAQKAAAKEAEDAAGEESADESDASDSSGDTKE